jgi:predicted RNase H-like nuclease
MRIIGLDLAWSARNRTGAAVVEGDEREGRLVASALLGDDDGVVGFVR